MISHRVLCLSLQRQVRKQGQDKWHTLKDVLDMRQAMKARRAASFKASSELMPGDAQAVPLLPVSLISVEGQMRVLDEKECPPQ